jgi:IS5 family transposase
LEHLYDDKEDRDAVLKLLGEKVLEEVDADSVHPGVSLWAVLVLGVARRRLKCDFDWVRELANEHRTLRQMLGPGSRDEGKRYGLQTIKDNVSKLTLEILNLIDWIIVNKRHQLLAQDEQPFPILAPWNYFAVRETNILQTNV